MPDDRAEKTRQRLLDAALELFAERGWRNTATAEISRRGQQLFDRIERLPMPTVAVIHGPCLGGGLEFALACQYRVARDDETTRLGLPEIQLGLLPGWGGTQRLPQRCPTHPYP